MTMVLHLTSAKKIKVTMELNFLFPEERSGGVLRPWFLTLLLLII